MEKEDKIKFDKIEHCTYSKDGMCKLIDGHILICNGKCSENSGVCKFYVGLRLTRKKCVSCGASIPSNYIGNTCYGCE